MSRTGRLLLALALVFVALPVLVGAGGHPDARSEHQRIVDFWTPERVAQAIPRDFVLDPNTRHFSVARGKPGGGGGGGGSTLVTGAHWTKDLTVDGTTGKVLFAMDGSYWVCSASAIQDSASNRSIILTAGHCVYDQANHAFASEWMFIPDYDWAPAPLNTSGTFCDATRYGCWTAEEFTVSAGFANAGGFNDQAVLYDWGFAAVGAGGYSGQLLEDVVGTQNYSFDAVSIGGSVTGWDFGYPAEKKYNGSQLIYCSLPITGDPYNANNTYRLNGCKLNGGSSGGPWFKDFDASTGKGTLISVNSYGYNGVTAIHGPMFNSYTQAAYSAALTAAGDTVVP